MRRSRTFPVLALVAVVGPLTFLVGGSVRPLDADAASCGPAPRGRVAVAVVVDDGRTPRTRCVEVPERATGYDVLIAAGHTLRIESGFLCAIDGVPASGCGNRPDFAGSYWRYFHASPGGNWSYSTVGGGGYRVPSRCAVEGWRWSDAPDAATTPRVAPPPVTCEATPAPTPTSPPPPPSPPPAPAPGPAPAPAAPATRPDAPPGPPAGPSGPSGAGDPAVSDTDPDRPTTPGASAPSPTDGPADPADPTATSEPDADPTTSSLETAGSGGVDPAGGDAAGAPEAEVLSGALDAGEPGGSPIGAFVGVAAMVSIAVAAVVRSARRRGGTAGRAPAE